MIIGTRKIWAAEMRVRVNPGRLDSYPAFFERLLHHVLSTLEESRRKNKSRLFNSLRS